MSPETSCGFVALVGATNAGKSTLLNQLVGSKVAIVSAKVQTTRTHIRGIAIEGGAQVIFVDTPGIFTPKRRLDRAMVGAAWSGAGDADVVVLLVDAMRGVSEDVEAILAELPKVTRRPVVLALNKVDQIDRPKLLALASELNEKMKFEATFMISALTGDGVAEFRAHLAGLMPKGAWLYPEDQVADVPLRSLAAEITREKIYQRMHQELPYAITVETETWKETKKSGIRIEQVIFVERESQKKIVIGKGGQMLKAIGQLARSEMEELFGQKVHLFLFVKVREGWAEDRERYAHMGLEFPNK